MQKSIILFQSTHNVIKAERLCIQEKIACQAIPVPRSMSSDCGIALEINSEDRSKVEVILAENAIYGEFRSPLNP